MARQRRPNGHWERVVLPAAAEIVDTSNIDVTLRQVFYRLVAAELIDNTPIEYRQLSRRSAAARRAGTFPRLADQGREIHRQWTFDSPDEALTWLAGTYRRDRTEGQPWAVYLGVEKNTMVGLLGSWFETLGLPILPLRGYSSQSYVDDVIDDVRAQDRPAVLIYGGDFDPSGEDILRDFRERAGCFEHVVKVALTAEQIESFDLPPQMGKAKDSRASQFIARHGRLVQVELEALPPDALQGLYRDAIDSLVDVSIFDASRERENRNREALHAVVNDWKESR